MIMLILFMYANVIRAKRSVYFYFNFDLLSTVCVAEKDYSYEYSAPLDHIS